MMKNILRILPLSLILIAAAPSEDSIEMTKKFVKDLPQYSDKCFLTALPSDKYDITELPGSLVKQVDLNKYRVISQARYIKSPAYALQSVPVKDANIFTKRVMYKSDVNGSCIIGGITIEKNELLEFTIQDLLTCTINDSEIPVSDLVSLADSLGEDEGSYFYITSATQVGVTYRKFIQQRGNLVLSGSIFCKDGKLFKGDETFSKTKSVYVALRPLGEIHKLFGRAANTN